MSCWEGAYWHAFFNVLLLSSAVLLLCWSLVPFLTLFLWAYGLILRRRLWPGLSSGQPKNRHTWVRKIKALHCMNHDQESTTCQNPPFSALTRPSTQIWPPHTPNPCADPILGVFDISRGLWVAYQERAGTCWRCRCIIVFTDAFQGWGGGILFFVYLFVCFDV